MLENQYKVLLQIVCLWFTNLDFSWTVRLVFLNHLVAIKFSHILEWIDSNKRYTYMYEGHRLEIQWNLINTDTKGTCPRARVHHIQVSVLSGLLEKTSGHILPIQRLKSRCFIAATKRFVAVTVLTATATSSSKRNLTLQCRSSGRVRGVRTPLSDLNFLKK